MPPASPLCQWTEIPRSSCPHCTGDLSVFEVVCNHGCDAIRCPKCKRGAPREDRGTRPERITLTAMSMGAFRVQEQQYEVVLGPCPGCQSWQIDYTSEAASSYAGWEMPEVHEFGREEAILLDPVVDMRPFHEVIEDALREHLEECPHLQQLVGELGL